MQLSVSQVYRVREGKRNINQKFIIGAAQAFPEMGLDDSFYIEVTPPPKPAVGGGTDDEHVAINVRWNRVIQEITNDCRHLSAAHGDGCSVVPDCVFFEPQNYRRLMVFRESP